MKNKGKESFKMGESDATKSSNKNKNNPKNLTIYDKSLGSTNSKGLRRK